MFLAKIRPAVVFLLILLAALALAACGDSNSLPADQVISKAATAIQSANSFHFTFEADKAGDTKSGLFLDKAEGDVAKPDKLTGSVDASYAGIPVNLKVIVSGQDQYMTDPVSGQWSKASADLNITQYFDPTKGASDILAKVKSPQSAGTENVGGTDTYKITGSVPGSALQALSGDVSSSKDVTTTLWIGTNDFLLRKVVLNGPLAPGEPANMVRTITFSDYNKDVKIETPQVAK